jgi:non-homologous end joining protein Ku
LDRRQHIGFIDAELETAEEPNRVSELKEFVPLSSVDRVCFQQTYHPRRRERKRKALPSFAEPLSRTACAAIAKLVRDGKDHLVLIRPYRNGVHRDGLTANQ